MLSEKIIPGNVHSLKFPIGNITKTETNPLEAVKSLVAMKKTTGIKLYRKKKWMERVNKREKLWIFSKFWIFI